MVSYVRTRDSEQLKYQNSGQSHRSYSGLSKTISSQQLDEGSFYTARCATPGCAANKNAAACLCSARRKADTQKSLNQKHAKTASLFSMLSVSTQNALQNIAATGDTIIAVIFLAPTRHT